MAQGTLIPSPKFAPPDNNGNPLPGGKLTCYLAGTTTLQNTYSDSGLTTPNANPVILDSSGRATIYLTPGASYKFVLTTSADAAVWTQDNVLAVPTSSSTASQSGTAGEAISAGQAVYLSDGSGSKNAGQWYKADTANAYSSVLPPEVGLAPAAISSGATGTIVTGGQVTGLAGLTAGSDYYIGSAGALTLIPGLNARLLGRADTTSSLVLGAPPNVPIGMNTVCGRLTLTTAVPVTSADVTAATTLFFTPYQGNLLWLFDGNRWLPIPFAEISIAVPATTSQMYDVFAYSNAGAATLELLAWTNDTTRATALTTQNGVYVKTGATTRRYLGSFRTTTVSGQTEDSATKRYVWNYYNRMRRPLVRIETTASWTYTTDTWRQANAAAANQVEVVIGLQEATLQLGVTGAASNGGAGVNIGVALGEDSTTTPAIGVGGSKQNAVGGISDILPFTLSPRLTAIGRHFYAWLERSQASGTTTWYSANGQAFIQSGIAGWIEG